MAKVILSFSSLVLEGASMDCCRLILCARNGKFIPTTGQETITREQENLTSTKAVLPSNPEKKPRLASWI